ncbi:hypothetical protein RBLE17_18620 [Rhodobacteraceae bacterium LE17]|jgi:hypothetical protein|nr:hypothetical protein [Rhodobacteraceae bacterium LE17]
MILAARSASCEAACIPTRIAVLILKLFAPIIVHSEKEFLYKHTSVKLDGVGSFFVNVNNGFSTRFPARAGVKTGWICYLFSGEIEYKSAGVLIKIKSSDPTPMYYLENTKNAEIKHNNCHILFVPVGAAHVDFVEARERLYELERNAGIGILEILKITNVSGGREFVLKEILRAQCISSKMDVESTFLVSESLKFRNGFKSIFHDGRYHVSTISRYELGQGGRLGKFVKKMKLAFILDKWGKEDEADIAAFLGYSTIYKMRDFLRREIDSHPDVLSQYDVPTQIYEE